MCKRRIVKSEQIRKQWLIEPFTCRMVQVIRNSVTAWIWTTLLLELHQKLKPKLKVMHCLILGGFFIFCNHGIALIWTRPCCFMTMSMSFNCQTEWHISNHNSQPAGAGTIAPNNSSYFAGHFTLNWTERPSSNVKIKMGAAKSGFSRNHLLGRRAKWAICLRSWAKEALHKKNEMCSK